jgi:thiosulfate/3-mercaptopyruvate sulfurtransferase
LIRFSYDQEIIMSLHAFPKLFLGLIAALSLSTAYPQSDSQAPPAQDVDVAMDTLVSTEWLSQHLDDPDLVILDCTVLVEQYDQGGTRTVSGKSSFDAKHIPGAGFADLLGDLSDPDSKIGFAVPTAEKFAQVMGALGVGDDTRVVLYDASGTVWAARVWWMLRWVGFDRVALLDGGLKAWTAEGRPLSSEASVVTARTLTPAVRPEMIADRDEVFASISDDEVTLIDSMPPASYRGEMVMYPRPGHITGATNIPVFSAFDETGHYKSQDELEAIFGTDHDSRKITYCGGGIAASSNAFVLNRLGFKNVAVYTASLQEWAADPANPMETVAEVADPTGTDK